MLSPTEAERSRLPGVEIALAVETSRPVLSPQLYLLWIDGDEGGLVRPGVQPFARLAPNQLLVRAPTQVVPSVAGVRGAVQARLLSIDLDQLFPASDEHRPRLPRFHSALLDSPSLVASARAAWNTIARGEPLERQQLAVAGVLRPALDGFAARGSRPPPLSRAVERARDLLHERFADTLRLDELAQKVAMSKCHLVHLFHKELGMPPHAYQIHLRVIEARRLVADGMPLGEVACVAGFADQSHLTRLFKRVVGIPPGQYAASLHRAPSNDASYTAEAS